MSRKGFTPEQIIGMLREAEVALSQGQTVGQVCRSLGISEQSYYRWIEEIWEDSEAFRRYRGTGWMPEPYRSCDQREIDWGGCRCQALALTGDAGLTDPACDLSPLHGTIVELASAESATAAPPFIYRRMRPGVGSARGASRAAPERVTTEPAE